VDDVLALADAEVGALPPSRAAHPRAEVEALRARAAEVKAAAPALATQHLALDGRAVMAILGAGPGPHVGEALRHLLDRVLEDPSRNTAAALEAELKAWWAARPRTA
jgi:tRNA nucleotidyltransferase (CCA-adding enzyme)